MKQQSKTEQANELLEKAISLVLHRIRYEGGKDDRNEHVRLSKIIDALKCLQEKIPSLSPEEKHHLIIEWETLLNTNDGYKSLWQKLEKEGKKEKRRKAVANTVASFELEGIYQTPEQTAWNECYIDGEITTEEWFKGGRDNDLNDDVRVRRKFGVVANALLEKAMMFVTWQLQTIRKKTEAFFDLSDEDKKSFDKLNFMIDELERLQKKIPGQTQEENHALSIEWTRLLHADDAHQSLWERLDKEGEKGRRRDAIEGTNANFELEGEYRSKEAQERAKRFINLELTEEEYFNFDSTKRTVRYLS